MKLTTNLCNFSSIKATCFQLALMVTTGGLHLYLRILLLLLLLLMDVVATLGAVPQKAISINPGLKALGTHSQILMTGGSDRSSYFIPQKITTSEFVYQKKSLLFLAYPQTIPYSFFCNLKKIPLFFSRPKNIPASFIDPKKITFGQIFRPEKITRTSPPPRH